MSELIKNPSPINKLKLLDLSRTTIHTRHYGSRAKESYNNWIKDIYEFLTLLAIKGIMLASTQKQALCIFYCDR